MKKLIPLFFGLMIPLSGAFAQSSPTMDAANQTIINTCQTEGGTFISFKDDKCDYSGCAYVGSNGAVSYDGNNERISGSCNLADYRAKAKAKYKADLDKKIKELEDLKSRADKIGSKADSGSGSGSGSGTADGKTPVPGAIYDENGNIIGSAGGVFRVDECAFDLHPSDPCYKKCIRKDGFLGIFGKRVVERYDRKACLKCLAGKGIYPVGHDGKKIGSHSVKVECSGNMVRGADGKCVHISGSGSIGSTGSGVIVGQATSGTGAGGNIIISGGVSGSAGIERPAYCNSSKKKDLKKCEEWMRANARFLCASSSNPALCMGGDYSDIMSRYDVSNCVNCGVGSRKQSTLSGIAEIVGAIAPPLAQFGSAWVGARAYQKGQEAWAGAAVAGFEQCQISQNNYMQYLSANELPGLSPSQQAAMGCNGFQLNGYAGLQNPYLGGWYGSGYTPGMIGGMMGPWGAYDPYGMGMGGMYPGMGMTGGIVGGIQLAGGINSGMMTGGYVGGYPGGMMTGGYVTGGYVGGYPGGMMTGGYVTGGYIGGYSGGAINPGYTGGYVGGMVNGISLAGGVAGGYPGGYMTGGYMAGGYAGGYMAGGMVGGGYAGGYMTGGYMAGGYAGGYMAGGMSGGFIESQQAANYDAMLQQQGMGLQVAGGGYSPYGAGGYPMNAGMNMGMYAGMGW